MEGKGKFLFIEGNNNIIFRISVIFTMLFIVWSPHSTPTCTIFSKKWAETLLFVNKQNSLDQISEPGVAYKSGAYKNHVNLFCSPLNMKKWLYRMGLFFCLSCI